MTIPGIDDRAVCYLACCGEAGRWSALAQACVPVLDRGFILGDGVYEVVPVYAGRGFGLDRHLARLRRSLAAVSIANPHDDAGWTALIGELAERNRALGADLLVYLQVTRGVAARDHGFPRAAVPTVFGMASPWVPPSSTAIEEGVAAVTTEDLRWHRCDIKSISLLGNVLARQTAIDQGAAEAVLLRDGMLTEAAAANVWVVHAGVLRTPCASSALLEGVRIGLIEEYAAAAGIPCERRPIPAAQLRDADEIVLSSAGREVLAVTRLDGQPVGSGRPGPVFKRLYDAYQRAKTALPA